MGADAGDRRLEPGRVALQRRGALGDLPLEDAVRERGRQAAPRLDVLEDEPALVDERPGQGLEPAGARRRIGDEAEIGFAQKDELAVAGETPREAVGKADGERMGQDADAVGAAEAGGKGGDRPAHDVHVRGRARSSSATRSPPGHAPCAARGRRPPRPAPRRDGARGISTR